jgi:stage V sporulation protein G
LEITEVRIKLMESSEDRLRGFCSVTFDDCFVVRDLKIIEGNNGPFVAMPSRKLTSNCPKCRIKNHLRAGYCNNCGSKLKAGGVVHDSNGRAKLYADIAHPVNATCREMIQNRVIDELNREIELAAQPGYKSRYDDDYDDELIEGIVEPKSSRKPGSSTASGRTQGSQAGSSTDSNSTDSPKVSGTKSERVDQASTDASAPHDPKSNPDVSSGRSKPITEDFGHGIFD